MELMKTTEKSEIFKTVSRPWGSYLCLEMSESFQVKKIIVNPGESLSLQLHKHRSEHWVIVSGEAFVTNGDLKKTLKEGEHTFIPPETKHRLENLGEKPLVVIEVQNGTYLGEDDIIRFVDKYDRV